MKAIPQPKQVRFLLYLSKGQSVTKACQLSDISRRSVYYWKAENPEFAEMWEDALNASVEELEDEVRDRALDRDDQKSAILLMFLLKKHRPEYRENYAQKKEVTIHHTREFDFTKEEMGQAIDILNQARLDSPPEEVNQAKADAESSKQTDKAIDLGLDEVE